MSNECPVTKMMFSLFDYLWVLDDKVILVLGVSLIRC